MSHFDEEQDKSVKKISFCRRQFNDKDPFDSFSLHPLLRIVCFQCAVILLGALLK